MATFGVIFIYTLDKGDLFMAKKVLTPAEAEIKALKKKYRKEKTEKIIPVILAIAIAVSSLAIGKSFGADKQPESSNTVNNNSQQVVQNDDSDSTNTDSNQVQDPSTNVDLTPDKNLADDPANWSKEQVVKFYKQSAAKSHDGAESSQTMTMPKMVVNNGDGVLGGFIKLVTPVINSVLTKQATTYGGITGGYNNLVASDVASAKAYKEGKYTVIEMTMVEQTDGLYGEPQDGTVGHAINVLGNVATAVAEFPQFDIKYEEADIKIHYANPTVKVRINENGIIEKGTWSYTAQIDIKHLQIESVMVDVAEAEIIYTIVVGGGF